MGKIIKRISQGYMTFESQGVIVEPKLKPRIRLIDNSAEPITAMPTPVPYVHCSHMHRALPRKVADDTIAHICELLKPIDFDSIAFRGMSGTIIAPIVAHLMGKEMLLVRKNKGEDCASRRWIEGFALAKRYVVIDDLICSGNSIVDTIHAVKHFTKDEAALVDICLYDDYIPKLLSHYQNGHMLDLLERADRKFLAGC